MYELLQGSVFGVRNRMAEVAQLSSSPCLATTDAKTPEEGEESQRMSGIQNEGSPQRYSCHTSTEWIPRS